MTNTATTGAAPERPSFAFNWVDLDAPILHADCVAAALLGLGQCEENVDPLALFGLGVTLRAVVETLRALLTEHLSEVRANRKEARP